MTERDVPSVPENDAYRARPIANAWLIDADYALTNPLEQRIKDETLEAIATRAKFGEPVILFSRTKERWLKHNIASRLKPIVGDYNALSRIIMLGSNTEGSFELRFMDENSEDLTEYHQLPVSNEYAENELIKNEGRDWIPEKVLESLERHDLRPGSFNLISTRSRNLKLHEEDEEDGNLIKPDIRMFHVGPLEDRIQGFEPFDGFLDKGTINALRFDLEDPLPTIPTISEMQFEKIGEMKKRREENLLDELRD